jgi:hypothetical protein
VCTEWVTEGPFIPQSTTVPDLAEWVHPRWLEAVRQAIEGDKEEQRRSWQRRRRSLQLIRSST